MQVRIIAGIVWMHAYRERPLATLCDAHPTVLCLSTVCGVRLMYPARKRVLYRVADWGHCNGLRRFEAAIKRRAFVRNAQQR